jgi:hypothetical protein
MSGGVLAYQAENNGQVGMVGRKPFLQILRFADLIKVLPGFQYIYGISILHLVHVHENK